jgi:periplasmic protein TonB
MNRLQKSKNKLEKLRIIFFQLGLIIACGFTFLAFEWSTPYGKIVLPEGCPIYEDGDYDVAPIIPEKVKPPEVKIERPKIVINPTIFKVVKNNTKIEEPKETKKEEPTLKYNPDEWKEPTSTDPPDEPIMFPGKMPEFVGGENAMFKYLYDSTKYPRIEIENNISGIVYVQFVVGKKGKIRDVKVVRGVSKLLDKEAVRVVKAMPDWKPGKQHGKRVSVIYNLPIRFTLKS